MREKEREKYFGFDNHKICFQYIPAVTHINVKWYQSGAKKRRGVPTVLDPLV